MPDGPAHASPLTSPWQAVGLAWVFAGLVGLYAAEDLHAWLAWGERAGPVRRAAGEAVLEAGRVNRATELRDEVDGLFAGLRNAPVLFARPLDTAEATPVAAPRVSAVVPEAEPPRRILVVGASSMQFHFGVELERCLETYAGVEVRRVGKLGTGLGRPQDFDWPAALPRIQAETQPDLVLAQFGGNDCTAALEPATGRRWPFGTTAWDEEYRRRVSQLAGGVLGRGARMGFLGQLAVRRPGNRRCFERVDAATRAGAEDAGAWFLSIRDLTLTGKDGVLEHVLGDGGVRQRIWTRDDLHLTRAGAKHVAAEVCRRLERRLSLDSGDPALGRVHRFESASAARGRTIAWYAVVPREIPEDGLPVLFLLHGGGGSAEDWMRLQPELQRLAVAHRIALVIPDGDPWGWYADGREPGSAIETYLVRELVPETERHLPLDGRRGIAGLSMGGHGAITLAVRNPGLFASASSMSGVVDLLWDRKRTGLTTVLGPFEENEERWREHSARQLLERRPEAFRGLALKLSCGAGDYFLRINREFHQALERAGVRHEYDETAGGHDWKDWTKQLPEHVAWHAGVLGRTRPDQRKDK